LTKFDTPWENRVFALAVALHEAGVVERKEFAGYHELERLLVESGVVTADEIAWAADATANERAHDHDH
jgi:hypothetical protein